MPDATTLHLQRQAPSSDDPPQPCLCIVVTPGACLHTCYDHVMLTVIQAVQGGEQAKVKVGLHCVTAEMVCACRRQLAAEAATVATAEAR